MAGRRNQRQMGVAHGHRGAVSWAESLGVALVETSDTVPAGWQTTEQIAREIGLSVRATSELIARKRKLGRVEMKRFRIRSGGTTRPVPHYKANAKQSRLTKA
jgi:hypothetical protein